MPRNSYYASPHWKALRSAALVRDGHRCTVPGCGERGTHVDHIRTRPNVDHPTRFDVMSNVRTLCRSHDSQIKELPSGKRRMDGKLVVKGINSNGVPLDPKHPWAAG